MLNRAAGCIALFRRDEDYAVFERVMLDAFERVPLRVSNWFFMRPQLVILDEPANCGSADFMVIEPVNNE